MREREEREKERVGDRENEIKSRETEETKNQNYYS